MKIEIPFSEVRPGEEFTSLQTKRAFRGVKVNIGTFFPFSGDSSDVNAVMTFYDHQPELGPQSGALIYVELDTLVEVERSEPQRN